MHATGNKPQTRPRRRRLLIVALLLVVLTCLVPLVPVARYQSDPNTGDKSGLIVSDEEFMPPGIVVQRWSLAWLLLMKDELSNSSDSCSQTCVVTVGDAQPIRYSAEREDSLLSRLKALLFSESRGYPLTVVLEDASETVANLTSPAKVLAAVGKVTVDLPQLGQLTIVRDRVIQPVNEIRSSPDSNMQQQSGLSAPARGWSGYLEDRSGDIVVAVDHENDKIAIVIHRTNETITILPSQDQDGSYKLDVIPSSAIEQSPVIDSRASVGATAGHRGMCYESGDQEILKKEAKAHAQMEDLLRSATTAPMNWCTDMTLPARLDAWPNLIRHYRSDTWKRDCAQCITDLHAFYAPAAVPTISVLPIVSAELLNKNGTNESLQAALDTAERHLNEIVLPSSRVRAKFEFVRPFAPISLGANEDIERAVVQSELTRYYKALRRFGPNVSDEFVWKPYPKLLELRKTHNADLVVLITKNHVAGAADGSTARIPASQQLFFSVVRAGEGLQPKGKGRENHIAGKSTFVHELMHMLGANHQLEELGQRLPPSGHGRMLRLTNDVGRNVGTIESQDVQRLPMLSDACGICGSERLGDAWTSNSKGVVASEVRRVANFAESWNTHERASPEIVCEDYASKSDIGPPLPDRLDKCPSSATEDALFTFDTSAEFLTVPSRLTACLPQIVKRFEDQEEDLLRSHSRMKAVVLVTGHADGFGSEWKNVGLSWARAEGASKLLREAVKNDTIYSSRQIPIRACYYGTSRPICDERAAPTSELAECRRANRRVEVGVIRVPDA